MKVQYEELKDNRINSRRSFVNEYLIVFTVVVWCCSGSVLIFNEQMKQNADRVEGLIKQNEELLRMIEELKKGQVQVRDWSDDTDG